MGCGQSKINLYPRRNKSSGKGQNGKKSGAADSKDGDEEDTGGSGDSHGSKDTEGQFKDKEDGDVKKEKPKIPLPPHGLGHAAAITEISASQQEFFKMLDEKIEKGRDYDSSSETEIQLEQARVASLLMHWESASQSSSQCNHSSPPTPSRRRQNSQERQSSLQHHPDQPRSPDLRRCLKNQSIRSTQSTSPASPPSRRSQTPQLSYQSSQEHPDKQLSESPKQSFDRSSPPTKRTQAAGAPNWKPNPKSATYNPKSGQKIEAYDDQRCYSPSLLSQKEIHQSYGVSSDFMDASRDTSQITYNPTFQSHSPAHGPNKVANPQVFNSQPYIAQIITYPMSQQAVSFHNANKYISQPTTYQQQQPGTSGVQRYPGRAQIGPTQGQPNIYYIAPTAMVPQPMQEQILTPKQQTALHLQQYVAMKQAQQQALSYSPRIPTGQIQDFSQYSTSPSDTTGTFPRKMYDDSYAMNFVARQQQINQKTQSMRQVAPAGLIQANIGQQAIGMPQYNQLVQRAQSVQNIQVFQNRPGCTASLGRNQSLSQKDLMNVDRYGFSNSSSPQNSVSMRNNVCQSLNIMTQKQVGQIVPMQGSQDLVIYQNVIDSDSRNRITDSNTSLSNVESNGSTNKNSMPSDVGNIQGRDHFFTTAGGGNNGEQCQSVNQQMTSAEQKIASKPHLGSNIVGRQMYYSQVVTGTDNGHMSNSNDVSAKKSSSESSLRTSRPTIAKKNSLENSSAGGYL